VFKREARCLYDAECHRNREQDGAYPGQEAVRDDGLIFMVRFPVILYSPAEKIVRFTTFVYLLEFIGNFFKISQYFGGQNVEGLLGLLLL